MPDSLLKVLTLKCLIKASLPVVSAEADETEAPTAVRVTLKAKETRTPTTITSKQKLHTETKERTTPTTVDSVEETKTGIPTPPTPPMPPIPTPPSTIFVSSVPPAVVVITGKEVTGTPPKVSKEAKETGEPTTPVPATTSTFVVSTEAKEIEKPTLFVSTAAVHIMTEEGTTDGEAQLQNQCSSGMHDCSTNGTCIPLKGSYDCNCNFGFEGDGRICEGKPISFFLLHEILVVGEIM